MTTHVLVAKSETDTTVQWECQVCHKDINFAKPGYGEPSATMFQYPDNVDDYMDPCPGEFVGQSRNVTRNDFLDRISTEELGALASSNDIRVRGLMFRIQNNDPIDLNNPQWLADFQHSEILGLLTAGRAEIICQ